MKILIMSGPNLSLTGAREPEHYGAESLDEVVRGAADEAKGLGAQTEHFQSDSEGELLARVNRGGFDGLLVNPGALSHYGLSLLDALAGCSVPVVEVHLSNLAKRERFRLKLVTARVADGVIFGLGAAGYRLGVRALVGLIRARD